MNPNTTIRPWILACGAQYGIRQAHDYRWDDADTRQHEMYCEYRMVSCTPAHVGWLDMSSSTGYDAIRKAAQKWHTTVEITLYNSQDGLYELASFCVAAKSDPNIRAIFDDQCSLIEAAAVQNISEVHDGEVEYIHQMVVVFEEDISFELSDTSAIVESIKLGLGDDYGQTIITEDGYFQALDLSAGTGDTVSTGTATFVEA